jgi:nucleoside phosphorylase
MAGLIVILTALPVEYHAVRSHLTDLYTERHASGTIYDVGAFESDNIRTNVAIAQIAMGNARGATEATKAIEHFAPSIIFMLGVGGGLKDDVVLGDVVIGSKVYGYELGAADNVFRPRIDSFHAPHSIYQLSLVLARQSSWRKRVIPEAGMISKTIVAPIASGEKVVKTLSSEAAKVLREHFSDAVAVEMEGYGVALAAHSSGTDSLIIRGISDMVEGKKEADASGSQSRASANAAAVAFELISMLQYANGPVRKNSLPKSLLDILTLLYPTGPVHEDIWRRSGGDLARLNLKDSGRTQWFSAIELLGNGGGGTTIVRLIDEILSDHPDNLDLKELARRYRT